MISGCNLIHKRNFIEDKRGQFVIVAAIIIATLTLAVSVSINQINVNQEELSYEPINEILLGLTSDLERAANIALRDYTQALTLGDSPETANETALEILKDWKESALTIYSPYEIVLNDPSNPDFDCQWWSTPASSISRIVVSYNINVGSYGYEGWKGTVAKYVMLNINSIDNLNIATGQTTITFSLYESSTSQNQKTSIVNLTPDLIEVGYTSGLISTFQGSSKKLATIDNLSYLGDGKYGLTFTDNITMDTTGIYLVVRTPEYAIYVTTYTILDIPGGTITVNVIADGSTDTFNFNITTGSDEFSFNVSEDNPWNSGLLLPGSYSIESLHDSEVWYLINPQNGTLEIELQLGESIDLTFIYTEPESWAQLYIQKSLYQTSSTENFTFTLNGPHEYTQTFNLTSSDNWDNNGTQLPSGIYTLTEEFPTDDWVLMDIKINGTATTIDNNQATINLSGNNTFNVEVINAHKADVCSISVQKITTYYTPNSFSFVINDTDNYFRSFSLTNGSIWTSGYLSPGNYSVIEDVPGGWAISKTTINGTISPTNNFKVLGNEHLNVVFENSAISDVGDWSTIYVTEISQEKRLVPTNFWTQENGHDQSYSSAAQNKAVSTFNSTITPQIVLGETITLTYYVTAQPGNAKMIRELQVELTFVYEGHVQSIGYCTFDLKGDQTIYVGTIYVGAVDYGYGLRTIPAGSIIQAIHTVTFYEQPGFTFLYYGEDTPTRIKLF